jgi:hypothetical protein
VRLRHRFKRLEGSIGPGPGYPGCRDRTGRVALVGSRRLPDGTTTPEGDRPAPCERCGEIPEQIIEVVEVVVETWEDAQSALVEMEAGRGDGREGRR